MLEKSRVDRTLLVGPDRMMHSTGCEVRVRERIEKSAECVRRRRRDVVASDQPVECPPTDGRVTVAVVARDLFVLRGRRQTHYEWSSGPRKSSVDSELRQYRHYAALVARYHRPAASDYIAVIAGQPYLSHSLTHSSVTPAVVARTHSLAQVKRRLSIYQLLPSFSCPYCCLPCRHVHFRHGRRQARHTRYRR